MMKILRFSITFIIILNAGIAAFSQITFGNNPDIAFILNQEETYQFNATADPDNEVYSLLISRPGMTINSTTGIIKWSPANLSDGGKVVIHISNSGYERTDTILFFVSEGLQCLSGAISYWSFDEMKNETFSDYQNNHVAFSPAPQHPAIIAGKVNNAVDITASDQGLNVPDNTAFHFGSNQSFSVSFWFKTNIGDREGNGVIIGRDEGSLELNHWWIGIDEHNQVNFFVRDEENYTDTARGYWEKFYNDFNWHHVVCVRDASLNKLKIYCDYDGTNPLTGNTIVDYPGNSSLFGATTSADLNIGFLMNSYQMNGSLDELIMFNRVLTEQEISDFFSKGVSELPVCSTGNIAPVFISDPDTVAFENQQYIYELTAKDMNDGDILNFSPVNMPAWMNYDDVTHIISGIPENSDIGKVNIRVKVTDNIIEVFQQFTLNVKNINDAPEITSPAVLNVNEEQSYSYQVTASDIDAGDVLTYALTQKPAWLSINSSTGFITGTPPLNDTGSYAVTVRVTDLASAFVEQSYNLDILNVNDAPVITGQTPNPLTMDEDQQLTITLDNIIYTDVDNPTEDITLTTLPGTNYTVSGNTITPALNFNGALTVNIQMSDLHANTAGTVSVSVGPVNNRPVFNSVPVTTATEDVAYIYNITVSDIDDDPLRLSGITIPSWLTLDTVSATLTGTPTNDQVGIHATAAFIVKLKVSDSSLDSTQTFVITVTNVNDAPEITGQNDTLLAQPNSSIALTIENIDVTDVDDLTSTLTLTVLPGTSYTIARNTVIVTSDATIGLLPVNIRISDSDNAKDEGIYYLRILITGLDERVDNLISRVYPTPASDYVVFEFAHEDEITIAIMDINGKLKYEETLSNGENKLRINTDSFNPGIYLYKVVSDNQQHTGRFVISNN